MRGSSYIDSPQATQGRRAEGEEMRELYHVCEDWTGRPESLYRQHGDDAYDMFEKMGLILGLGLPHYVCPPVFQPKAAQDHLRLFT